MVPLFKSLCEHTGTILVAVDSRGSTWDGIRDGYGPDIEFIDKALNQTFSNHNIDARHMAVVGFSDGASYALSIGIPNGDVFSYIIAYSPGFMAPPVLRGVPKVFVSHGVADTCLSIDRCSRRVVPKLQNLKLDVSYHEFEGGHTVPESIAKESFNWFLGERIARAIMSATAEPESGMERA
jgi:phospholipase/carboxylesterase